MKNLSDIELHGKIIEEIESKKVYEVKQSNSEISLLDKIKENSKIKQIIMDSNILPEIDGQGESDNRIEDFFIDQIMRKIAFHGIEIMSLPDFRDFKSTIV